jgi:hypothetical protein
MLSDSMVVYPSVSKIYFWWNAMVEWLDTTHNKICSVCNGIESIIGIVCAFNLPLIALLIYTSLA